MIFRGASRLRGALQPLLTYQRPIRSTAHGEGINCPRTGIFSAVAGIEPSVLRRRDSYDNALAETIIGSFKTEVIHHRGPWEGMEDFEFATLCWVAWYNTERIMEPLGYLSPANYEAPYAEPFFELGQSGT